MRFQPCLGRLLAAAVDNFVSIFDVETLACRLKLQVSSEFSIYILTSSILLRFVSTINKG